VYRLGELIRVWRKDNGRPLASVAGEIGISISTLRRLELVEKQVGGGRQGRTVNGGNGHGNGHGSGSGSGGHMDGESVAKVLRWALDQVEQADAKGEAVKL